MRAVTEYFGQPAGRGPSLELHLPQPVLRVYESLGEESILPILRIDMGTPQRSRKISALSFKPNRRNSPDTWGNERRAIHPASAGIVTAARTGTASSLESIESLWLVFVYI